MTIIGGLEIFREQRFKELWQTIQQEVKYVPDDSLFMIFVPANTCLIAMSDRLVLVKTAWTLQIKTFTYPSIVDVSVKKAWLSGSQFVIKTRSGEEELPLFGDEDPEPFVQIVRSRMEGRTPTGHGPGSMVSDLERLAELRRTGDITDEEFSKAKKKLIGS